MAEYIKPVGQIRYCLYARKSTEQDERQALSIDSQIKEMVEIANRDGLDITDVRRESHSAKNSGSRPIFNQLIADLRTGKFNAILTWAPDRLSRNAGDLGSLVDLMDQKVLHEIRTYGQKFTNSPNEKFLLMILCSQAKLENDNKGVNVKRGLRTRLEMGLWPECAPTGYLNEKRTDRKGYVIIDPRRAPVIKKMFEKVGLDHLSGRKLYQWLKYEVNFQTKNGKHLSLSNIYKILKSSFYYGSIEYPRGSGKWYTGKHQPIISQGLFDQVQEQLTRDNIVRSESKEFAFTKLMVCGTCGSGISAQEKYKKLKDGTTNKYIYYGCTRSRDLHCKSQYIREEELVSQLVKIFDQIDINELGVKIKLEEEIQRFHKFQYSVLKAGSQVKPQVPAIDIKTYAKYLLREGSVNEKRELLGSLKSTLKLNNKKLALQPPVNRG